MFFPRGARKTHHQIAAVPIPMLSSLSAHQHPPDIPPPPTNVLDDRTRKETGSDTAPRLPGSEELEECNQNQNTFRQADPPRKRRPCSQQVGSTPNDGPSAGTFTYPPPPSNLPGAFAFPPSHLSIQPLTRTATDWICTPGGSPPPDHP